jgi:hypothetical protein
MDAEANFQLLTGYVTLVAVVVLGGFLLLIGYRMLIGEINTKGLLDDKAEGGPSPARLQLCLLSLGGAFYYLMMVVNMVQAHASLPAGPLSLPEPPKELLALVLGSNTFYVAAKANSTARRLSGILSFFR